MVKNFFVKLINLNTQFNHEEKIMKTKTNKTFTLLALALTAIFFVSTSYAKGNMDKKQKVQKYRVTQISDQDVTLDDTGINSILQNDKMQNLLKSEDFKKLAQSEDFRIDYPKAKRIDYPKAWRVDYPKAKRIDFPKAWKVDYPKAKRIDFPKAWRVDYPKAKRIDFPKARRVDYPRAK